MGYAAAVAIVACPFCREMFEKGEAKSCPVCGIALQRVEKLPPSQELLNELGEDGVPPAPEHEILPWGYRARGRGALLLLSLAGLVSFFLPWIHLTLPYIADLSGFDLSRRLGWSWGAGVAWVVLVATVGSRRTIAQLRGARVAAAFLAAVPAVTAVILLSFPPRGGLLPVRFTFGLSIYGTIASSVMALAFAIRLGGKLDDIQVSRGTSRGQFVH
jgi:hypothetical protein